MVPFYYSSSSSRHRLGCLTLRRFLLRIVFPVGTRDIRQLSSSLLMWLPKVQTLSGIETYNGNNVAMGPWFIGEETPIGSCK